MSTATKSTLPALALGAIGVVYGDIGTSVLYAIRAVFLNGKIEANPLNVYGILSFFFWAITIIVTVKYVTLVLRADNNGEGGVVSLLALVSNAVGHKPRVRKVLLLMGIFGASLFYGDGVITPAISVLSAVEGLIVISPGLHHYVIPITLVILFILFWSQKKGTGGIGKLFGPIMVLWFIVIALIGVINILDHPDILWAVSPYYALNFIIHHSMVAFIILGAVVLCVTGGEALYADMGHFGRGSIQLAWYALVMPALLLNYFGQGALLLSHPTAVENPFFQMVPTWALIPLVILATMATVIASQALISGTFSVTKQIIQLGYLPRLQIVFTNEHETGQIYIPFVNWVLFVAIVLAVLIFHTSDNLAGAYGVAVTSNMVITTILTYFVVRYVWHYPLIICLVATGFFLIIDVLFWSSNLLKLPEGGWFPLVLALFLMLLMLTWKLGRQELRRKLISQQMDLSLFLNMLMIDPPHRVDGTAVYLNANAGTVPHSFLHNLKHNKVLHKQLVFVTVVSHEMPRVAPEKRLEITQLYEQCWQVLVHYGFMDETNLPQTLKPLETRNCHLEPMQTSYFISRETIVANDGGEMPVWQEKIFSQLHRNAGSIADFMQLPENAVVELGSQVDL